MSAIRLEIAIDNFDAYPVRLLEDQITVHGSNLAATIDLSRVSAEQGADLGSYVEELESTLRKSKFHWQYELVVSGVSPERISADLSRIHFREVNFEATDLSGSGFSNGVRLTRCLVDSSLPPVTVHPGELFRYPPVKAARELNMTNPKDVFILRWGLSQDARHLGQAFLWLERRYPQTEALLSRLLKGLPARPARRRPWSP